jgi:hypothetical protein
VLPRPAACAQSLKEVQLYHRAIYCTDDLATKPPRQNASDQNEGCGAIVFVRFAAVSYGLYHVHR